ncbi:MAG: hypothetical protein RMJ28_00990 [Nitrososphaerota archaeon]|nr:hypothetical protein [Candidatus Calditenuaceae archaeon]MDW8072808.1 hypothetical protein [Nitrososphaerota archaeon]
MTLFSLTNQILETSIMLMKMGVDFQGLRNLVSVLKILKDVDAVVIPSDFLDKLIAELYKNNQREIQGSFKQLGGELAEYFKLEAMDIEKLVTLAQTLSTFFPLKRVSLRRLDHSSYELSAVGVGGRLESTVCVYYFIEGVLEKYGFEIQDKTISRGLINIRFSEKF